MTLGNRNMSLPLRIPADFWWRLVSEDDNLKEYDLCRIEPQYYVGSLKNHNGVSKCLFLQLENHRDDHNIVSKAMFVRRIPKKWNKDIRTHCEAMDCIPVQEVPEYRSANCYYIRSKAIPHEYWHLQHGYVHVSNTERTSFCIARALGIKVHSLQGIPWLAMRQS
ncbi:hypothetical protein BDZ91DRAFT_242682 [Kalaharituber pfeilii]|nr:hypothetical protein BDZ91DRAFT_242682 [Kalaharituber pfeilii]